MPKKKVIPPHPDKSSLGGWAEVIKASSEDFHKKMIQTIASHPEQATLLKIAKGLYHEEFELLHESQTPPPFESLKEGRKVSFLRDALGLYQIYQRIDNILKKKDL